MRKQNFSWGSPKRVMMFVLQEGVSNIPILTCEIESEFVANELGNLFTGGKGEPTKASDYFSDYFCSKDYQNLYWYKSHLGADEWVLRIDFENTKRNQEFRFKIFVTEYWEI